MAWRTEVIGRGKGKGQVSDRGSELMNQVLGLIRSYADLRGSQNTHCDPPN